MQQSQEPFQYWKTCPQGKLVPANIDLGAYTTQSGCRTGQAALWVAVISEFERQQMLKAVLHSILFSQGVHWMSMLQCNEMLCQEK